MSGARSIRVGVNGFGVIGKRVAEGVLRQSDMDLAGVVDVATDWRIRMVVQRGLPVFAPSAAHAEQMRAADIDVSGTLEDLLGFVDVIVDCTPKRVGAENAERYRKAGVKFVLQGGEKHAVTGHSFVAEVSYESALGRDATRVVSCNTTSIVRVLSALKRAGLLRSARGTLLRRATDPWESHLGGIMNTVLPEPEIPSHQAPDARTVDPDLDVVTAAVKVPETLGHVHVWFVRLSRPAGRDEVLRAFRSSSRIALFRTDVGLGALNTVKELMLDLGRPHGDLYEVALWEDTLAVQGDEAYFAYMVDNQAIVIPETIDAVRALCATERDPVRSIRRTNETLGVRTSFL